MNKHIIEVYVLRNALKQPIHYTQGSDALPILFLFKDYVIPDGTTAAVFVSKPSGKGVHDDTAATVNVGDNSVTVNVTKQMVAEAGTAYLQLELVQGEDTLFTFNQPLEVKRSATPIVSENGMTFLDEAVVKVDAAIEQTNEAAEDARVAIAEIEAKSVNGDFSASITIGEVLTGEPGSAAAVTNSGTKKDTIFNFIIPAGPQGPSGVMAPSSGMFCLWTDPATGDLYVDYPDGTEPPAFRYDSETGDLYYEIEREDGTVATLHIGNIRNPLINNLTTATAGQGALDASQGKILQAQIDQIKEAMKNVIATDQEAE